MIPFFFPAVDKSFNPSQQDPDMPTQEFAYIKQQSGVSFSTQERAMMWRRLRKMLRNILLSPLAWRWNYSQLEAAAAARETQLGISIAAATGCSPESWGIRSPGGAWHRQQWTGITDLRLMTRPLGLYFGPTSLLPYSSLH